MGAIRTGTVGYSYRDWAGIFYPQGAPSRRQFNIYAQNFDTCELTQFSHTMPDPERMQHFAAQIKTDMRLFVRLHNTFTHCADVGLALTVAKHFRKAMEPLRDAGKLGGLVAAFPYAFKNSEDAREYIIQLSQSLAFEGMSLHLDFRHPSWSTEGCLRWMGEYGLGYVCVDEPRLPGLVPPLVVATTDTVLVRFHGRNAEAWWSGNATTRYDYLYSSEELRDLAMRYQPLIASGKSVNFLFQNHWQAQAVRNAIEWKSLVSGAELARPMGADADESSIVETVLEPKLEDEDESRPPTTLSLSEVKSRVSLALQGLQTSLELPPRKP
jgi:uncharacterized protein YecE (DUF72 family)